MHTPSVGEALSLPLARSALGSTSGGAAEQNEAEGVYPVGCCSLWLPPHPVGVANLVTRWREAPLAPPLGELPSKARLMRGGDG